ncbi:MAG TPA: hypothetical protein PKD53_19980 [Chloroflexaceae bacterium]|nr:hypothetical protein [Chloroflexaceae bacterium]
MSFTDIMLWVLSVTLFAIYITCIFTVCSLTFQKGYKLLGWVGIFFPFLWLVGAVLPAKPGSQFARKQAAMR